MRSILVIAAASLAIAGCGRSESGSNANATAGANAAEAKQAQPAPDMAAFAEFDRTCRGLTDLEKLTNDAEAGGWEEFEPEAGSDAGKILEYADRNVKPLLGDAGFNNWSYRKQAGGRELVLIVSEIESGPGQSAECRVYDFTAPQPPTDQAVGQWTNAAPTQRLSQQGVTAYKWTPGFRDALSEISVVHMDRNSPLRQQIPAVGLGISATLSARPAG